jgi:hypothetical protein
MIKRMEGNQGNLMLPVVEVFYPSDRVDVVSVSQETDLHRGSPSSKSGSFHNWEKNIPSKPEF